MAEIDCSSCNKWCNNNIDSKGCVCLGRCLVGVLVLCMIGIVIAVPIINIVAIFWYTENFNNLMYFYLATVSCECLLQFAISIPTWNILVLSIWHIFDVFRYVVPYYYPIIFSLIVCNCVLSMLKLNVGYKTQVSLFVIARLTTAMISACFYNMAGREKIEKEKENERLRKIKANPPSCTVQHVYLHSKPKDELENIKIEE